MGEEKAKPNTQTYFPEFRIYKPKPTKDGAASKLQLKVKQEEYREVMLFWEIAQQTGLDDNGNASFAWAIKERKVVFKMEAIDIGEVLAVLNGLKKSVGVSKEGKPGSIFHKNATGNSVFKFTKMEKDGNVGYWLEVSSKKNTGELVSVKHTISASEGEILRIVLQDAISCIYNWR